MNEKRLFTPVNGGDLRKIIFFSSRDEQLALAIRQFVRSGLAEGKLDFRAIFGKKGEEYKDYRQWETIRAAIRKILRGKCPHIVAVTRGGSVYLINTETSRIKVEIGARGHPIVRKQQFIPNREDALFDHLEIMERKIYER